MSASFRAVKSNLDEVMLSYHKDSIRQAVLGKIARRLLPFLFILHLIAFLDRSNLPYAQLQMDDALSFSYTTYGIGAGVFFVGYFLFGVPSSMFLERVGPKRGIACLTVTWGIITMGMAFINSPLSFYAMRFLLGIAEAGFFPGVIRYLMYWLPAVERARYFSCFIVAIPIAGISGSMIAGFILSRDAIAGIAGWQWIFLGEGFTAVVLGIIAIFYLTDSPDKTAWLSREERWWIQEALRADECKEIISTTLRDGLLGAKVLTLGMIYSTFIFASTGFVLWSPLMLRGFFHLGDSTTSFIGSFISVASALAMMANGIHSDRTGERYWHVALPALVGAIGILMAAILPKTPMTFVALLIAAAGMGGLYGPFWAIPAKFLRGNAAASGIALINALGNVSAFLGPLAIGWSRDQTGEFSFSLIMMAISLFSGACLMIITRDFYEARRGDGLGPSSHKVGRPKVG